MRRFVVLERKLTANEKGYALRTGCFPSLEGTLHRFTSSAEPDALKRALVPMQQAGLFIYSLPARLLHGEGLKLWNRI